MATRTIWQHILFIVSGVMCTVLNSTEIILIIKKRKSMKTFELILLSLAIADLTVGISTLAFSIYDINQREAFSLNDPEDFFVLAMQTFTLCSSITHILGISLDRVLAVKFPLKHRIWMSRENAKWLVAAIWLASTLLTAFSVVPKFVFNSDSGANNYFMIYALAGMMFFFGLIFVAIYSHIIWKVIIRSQQFNQRINGKSAERKGDSKMLPTTVARERTLVFTCVLAVSTYISCTYPAAIIAINGAKRKQPVSSTAFSFWLPGLLLINSILDPFVYFLKGYLDNRSRQTVAESIRSTTI